MDQRRSAAFAVIVGLLVVAIVVYALYPLVSVSLFGPPDSYERTTVTVSSDGGEERGSVEARVADDRVKRYAGLSYTDSLDENEGMWFVHDGSDSRTYVMRGMSFGIDIVFVSPNGTITSIHHAEKPANGVSGEAQQYGGEGQYVLEVPYDWTTDHGVTVGDCLAADGYETTCAA